MKKKNFRIQISKLRNEQNPFEKPAKNLEQNSLDSLLTSTTWKRGRKKRNQKLQIERRTKAAERKKKRKRKKKKPKAANREKNKSCGKGKKKKERKKKKWILTLMVSGKVRVISFNERG